MTLKKLLFSAIYLFQSSFLLAQITIDYPDWQAGMETGIRSEGYVTQYTEDEYSVFVGTASVDPQTWDFTGYNFKKSADLEFVNPAETPYFNRVPSANICRKGKFTDLTEDYFTYQYYEQTSSEHLQLGVITDESDLLTTIYNPPVPQMIFPSSLGAYWEYQGDTVYNPIIPELKTVSKMIWSIDAYGTLKLPHGDFPVLRATVNTISESYTPAGYSTTRSISYNFIDQYGTTGAFISIDTTQEGLETVLCKGISYETPSVATGLRNTKNPVAEFRLLQNFPNPFNPSTTFNFNIPKTGFTKLTVYDILGKEVETIFDEELTSGEYNIEWSAGNLSSGVYYCNLTMEDYSQTIKIILIK